MITHDTKDVNADDRLTRAIKAWVLSVTPDWSNQKRDALIGRLGWTKTGRRSLQEIGYSLNLSAEAVRRAERVLWDRLSKPPVAVVNAARDCSDASRPLPRRWSSLQTELVAAGLASEGLDAAGLARLIDLAKITPKLELIAGFIVRLGSPPPAPVAGVVRVARARARACGVCSISWLREHIPGDDADHHDLLATLAGAGFIEVEPGWVSDSTSPKGRDRLANLVRRMLGACGPLSLEDVMGGLERQVRFGRLPELPPRSVLGGYLKKHPDFEIHHHTIESRVDLDPEQELGLTERTLRESLWRSAGASLSRGELWRAAKAAGVDLPTFNTVLTYSPIVEKDGRNRWSLRGRGPIDEPYPTRPVAASPVRFTWDESGRLILTGVLGSGRASLLPVPRAVQPFVESREFQVESREHNQTSVIRVRRGVAWGFSTYFSMQRRQKHQAVILAFDLSNSRCRVSFESSHGQ